MTMMRMMLPVEPAPFVFVRRAIVFFFLKVSPVKQKATSSNHRNCKLFICDLAIAEVIKKLLRPIFYQACSVLDIEQHKITNHDNGSSDYEQNTHSRHPVSAAPAAYLFLPSHVDMVLYISLLIMFAFRPALLLDSSFCFAWQHLDT